MYSATSPRKASSSVSAEADAFVKHYYGTAFGDVFDASRRSQTLFSATVTSSTQQYMDRPSHMATPSPLLSNLSALPSTWDASDMGLATWVDTDTLQSSEADAFLYGTPTPSYPTGYLPEPDTNYGISPSLISPDYNLSSLPYTSPDYNLPEMPYTATTATPTLDCLALSATPERAMPSTIDDMSHALQYEFDFSACLPPTPTLSLSTPAASPSSIIDTPPPSTPDTLYEFDMDADGETDDEYVPDAPSSPAAPEEEYIPKPKTRGSQRKPPTHRTRSSHSPRTPTKRITTPRAVPAITAPRVSQASTPYTELTPSQVASRTCPVCGASFRGEHGASDLRRHHACHFPDSSKWMCRGVAVHRARERGLDPEEAVMFMGERRCGVFCGRRFSRKDALLRHLRNSSEGCVSEYV